MHPDVAARLARLAPDQRAAATAPPGPVLCVAPAGSGKTTTLVARIAWLVAMGTPPARITAVTFNKRAADELGERLSAALEPLGVGARDGPRVRTFHALGREVLDEAGAPVTNLVDRSEVLRRMNRRASCAASPASPPRRRLLSLEARRSARRGWSDPAPVDARSAGRRAVARLRRIRALAGRQRRARLRRPGAARARAAAPRRTPAGRLARALLDAACRRGPGRRPLAARAGGAACRRAARHLPRRRRRSDHLCMAVWPTCAGCSTSQARCRACGGSTWSPTTAVRGRSWSVRSS